MQTTINQIPEANTQPRTQGLRPRSSLRPGYEVGKYQTTMFLFQVPVPKSKLLQFFILASLWFSLKISLNGGQWNTNKKSIVRSLYHHFALNDNVSQ